MRIPSGKTDQLIFFVAVDSTDLVTRKTGLSSFTVYRSRKGGTATVYTTPTIAELSSSNMPGVYSLLVDEDTTVDSGSDSEEYAVHITCSGMAPVTRTIELYRRAVTSGRTLAVDSSSRVDVGSVLGTAQTAGDLAAAIAGVQSDTDNIQTRIPAALVSGRMDSSIGAVASGVIAAASFAANALDAVWSTASRLLTAGTNIALAKGTGVTGFNDLSAAQVNAEADTALSDVGLTTTITGRVDAAISTRLASASYTAPDNSSITAIKAKTDNLPSDPADESLVIAATDAIMGRLGAPAGASVSADVAAVKTDTGAIKTKTDNLPASPAATGDIPSANITAIKAKTDNLPASPAAVSDIPSSDITAIKAKTDNLPASPSAVSDIPTANNNADALLDRAAGIETNRTLRQGLRLMLSAMAGKASGLGTVTAVYRDTNDTKDRITATVDTDGNRTAVSLDAS